MDVVTQIWLSDDPYLDKQAYSVINALKGNFDEFLLEIGDQFFFHHFHLIFTFCKVIVVYFYVVHPCPCSWFPLLIILSYGNASSTFIIWRQWGVHSTPLHSKDGPSKVRQETEKIRHNIRYSDCARVVCQPRQDNSGLRKRQRNTRAVARIDSDEQEAE